MPEIYTQDVSGCMADTIGDGGLTADALATARTAAWDLWLAIREDISEVGFPAVSIAAQADDLGAIDAGGDFSLQIGSGAAMILGVVDKDALAFFDLIINEAGFYNDPYAVTVPAGNHCIWAGPSDFNLEWTCASGAADTVFTVN